MDVEVVGGALMYCNTNPDWTRSRIMAVGGNVDMLCELAAVSQIQ